MSGEDEVVIHGRRSIVSVRCRRLPGLTLAVCAGLVTAVPRASACGGPCATPSFWDVQDQQGTPVVVTNFGLLTESDEGWTLTCEERIGGLILEAATNGRQVSVSTDLGLFMQEDSICDWQPGPASERSPWLLAYQVTEVEEDGDDSVQVALVYDAAAQRINLERVSEARFEVLRTLENETSYRQLQVSQGMKSIFVAGYAALGRTWKVTFSLDQAQTWQEATPAFDREDRALYLRYVDSRYPDRALVLSQSTLEEADEVWRFDASEPGLAPLLVLDDGQIVVGVTVKDDWLWVAARNGERGSLHRAPRDTLEFSQVTSGGPPFSCLSNVRGALYVCVDDFTRGSEFILGVSHDDGATWLPRMTLADLGQVNGCGAECAVTTNWLRETYTTPTDAGASEQSPQTDGPTAQSEERGGGCQLVSTSVQPKRDQGGWVFVGLLLLAPMAWARKRLAHRYSGARSAKRPAHVSST